MAMKKSLENLPHGISDLMHLQRKPFDVKKLLHVDIEVLEDQVELIALFTVYYIKHFDDARVVKLLK